MVGSTASNCFDSQNVSRVPLTKRTGCMSRCRGASLNLSCTHAETEMSFDASRILQAASCSCVVLNSNMCTQLVACSMPARKSPSSDYVHAQALAEADGSHENMLFQGTTFCRHRFSFSMHPLKCITKIKNQLLLLHQLCRPVWWSLTMRKKSKTHFAKAKATVRQNCSMHQCVTPAFQGDAKGMRRISALQLCSAPHQQPQLLCGNPAMQHTAQISLD